MGTLSHPDQSWEAIQDARANSTKNPAPPTRGTPIVVADAPSEPAAPKPGQPGYAYPPPAKPIPSPEQIMDVLNNMGFSDMQAAAEGLKLQNEALSAENVQLKTRADAAESALKAGRAVRTSTDGVTDAEFEDIAEAHAP